MQIEIARFTDDVPALANFYQKLLGRKPDIETEAMAIFVIDNVKLFIHEQGDPVPDGPPNEDHIAFSFDHVNQITEEAAAKGIHFLLEPQDYYWGRSAYVRDPDGRLVEITDEPTQP
jgi:catechol 2,3-dioxygenase-like lactoylglutathione lyase family enzyme